MDEAIGRLLKAFTAEDHQRMNKALGPWVTRKLPHLLALFAYYAS
jgi:hypothetical protein